MLARRRTNALAKSMRRIKKPAPHPGATLAKS
jgi:hypothetical protein